MMCSRLHELPKGTSHADPLDESAGTAECRDQTSHTDVVGIFPNDASITRLVGALLIEQNDEWSLQRRYMQLEGLQSLSENQAARLSAVVS